jgi:hypothetical protein
MLQVYVLDVSYNMLHSSISCRMCCMLFGELGLRGLMVAWHGCQKWGVTARG